MKDRMITTSISEVMWLGIGRDPSFELMRVVRGRSRIMLIGTVLAAIERSPLRVDYTVHCDNRWNTRRVRIAQTWKGITRDMKISHDGKGHWVIANAVDESLTGCTDIDLSISPATNSLPINRLKLRLQEKRSIIAAWIRFPKLIIVPSRQSYRRVSPTMYEFRVARTSFRANVAVDGEGLPVRYQGLWKRIATV